MSQPINMVYNEVNEGEQHAICSHAALGPGEWRSDPGNYAIGTERLEDSRF